MTWKICCCEGPKSAIFHRKLLWRLQHGMVLYRYSRNLLASGSLFACLKVTEHWLFPRVVCCFNIVCSLGNIIHQKVEAIVNAANVHLDHSSGIAKCIKDAAGKKFNDECKQLVKKHGGRLKTAEPVYTSAGKIPPPVKYVIHVAGPEARNFGDKNVLRDAVKRTFENVLMYANDELKVSSVAIPAISSGMA